MSNFVVNSVKIWKKPTHQNTKQQTLGDTYAKGVLTSVRVLF